MLAVAREQRVGQAELLFDTSEYLEPFPLLRSVGHVDFVTRGEVIERTDVIAAAWEGVGDEELATLPSERRPAVSDEPLAPVQHVSREDVHPFSLVAKAHGVTSSLTLHRLGLLHIAPLSCRMAAELEYARASRNTLRYRPSVGGRGWVRRWTQNASTASNGMGGDPSDRKRRAVSPQQLIVENEMLSRRQVIDNLSPVTPPTS